MSTDLLELGSSITKTGNSDLDHKYLTFWTDNQLFGISIADVVQIVGMQGITQIPEFPYYAKGIINLRGIMLPVIDMRLRLGRPETEYSDRTCIIVTNIHEHYYGLVVDEVDEVTDILSDQIASPPQISGDPSSSYLTGVAHREEEGKLILTIDTARLLGDLDLTGLDEVTP